MTELKVHAPHQTTYRKQYNRHGKEKKRKRNENTKEIVVKMDKGDLVTSFESNRMFDVFKKPLNA